MHTAGITRQDVELVSCCGGSTSSSCSCALRRFARLQCLTCNGTGRAQQYNFPYPRSTHALRHVSVRRLLYELWQAATPEVVKTEQPCFQGMNTGTAFFHKCTRD